MYCPPLKLKKCRACGYQICPTENGCRNPKCPRGKVRRSRLPTAAAKSASHVAATDQSEPCHCPDGHGPMLKVLGGPEQYRWVCPVCKIERMWPDAENSHD